MTNEAGEMLTGSDVTIAAFKTILGTSGGWLVTIGITLFAFSTILGWEYHGEKAFEYLLGTHKFNMIYRVVFSFGRLFGMYTDIEPLYGIFRILRMHLWRFKPDLYVAFKW